MNKVHAFSSFLAQRISYDFVERCRFTVYEHITEIFLSLLFVLKNLRHKKHRLVAVSFFVDQSLEVADGLFQLFLASAKDSAQEAGDSPNVREQ